MFIVSGAIIENLIKVCAAVFLGGLIGAEREYQDKAAGFRTIILITLGSTLYTIFSISLDPGFTRTRIAANIVTGIGFLGAGAIVRERGRIGGLTTAATIWLSAAIGMGIGAGEIYFCIATTAITIFVLLFFPMIEERIDKIRETRSYRIATSKNLTVGNKSIKEILAESNLKVIEQHLFKSEQSITSTWRAVGSPGNHEKFIKQMMEDKEILELDY